MGKSSPNEQDQTTYNCCAGDTFHFTVFIKQNYLRDGVLISGKYDNLTG
jgi:hypothetical protein